MSELIPIITEIFNLSPGENEEAQEAGQNLEPLDVVRYSEGGGNVVKADADNDFSAEIYGIVLNKALTGNPVVVQRGGRMNVGSILQPGKIYVLSGTAGKIQPVEFLSIGQYLAIIGYAFDERTLVLLMNDTQVERGAAPASFSDGLRLGDAFSASVVYAASLAEGADFGETNASALRPAAVSTSEGVDLGDTVTGVVIPP